jgi:hypothetical protein
LPGVLSWRKKVKAAQSSTPPKKVEPDLETGRPLPLPVRPEPTKRKYSPIRYWIHEKVFCGIGRPNEHSLVYLICDDVKGWVLEGWHFDSELNFVRRFFSDEITVRKGEKGFLYLFHTHLVADAEDFSGNGYVELTKNSKGRFISAKGNFCDPLRKGQTHFFDWTFLKKSDIKIVQSWDLVDSELAQIILHSLVHQPKISSNRLKSGR